MLRCIAFLEWVGLQILSRESVDYFGTSEYTSMVEKKKNLRWRALMSAYKSCDGHAVYFWR